MEVKVDGYVKVPAQRFLDLFSRVDDLLEVLARQIDYSNRILEGLVLALGKPIPEVKAVRVELPAYNYVFYLDSIFRWLEHAKIILPTIVEVPLTVSAGESGYCDLWLPENIACVERCFEVFFPSSRGLKYGWMVDSKTDYTVPKHLFIPNRGYVEESVFGKYWIKWYFLRFHYEAIDAGQIIVRAWARLIRHDLLEKLLDLAAPIAEMFELEFPAKREKPSGSSPVVKKCSVCGAEIVKVDDKLIRRGVWGRSYTDHSCEVFG